MVSVPTATKKNEHERLRTIISRLDDAYGIPEWRPHHDATSELVLTILSQNTSDSNSGRAFARLLQPSPTGTPSPRRRYSS